MDIKAKWNEILKKLNIEGVTLAFIKDPKTQKSSVSLTLVIVSFTLVIVGIIGKWGGKFQIDVGQSLNLFYACSALYWGRKFSSGDKTIEAKEEEKN